MALRVVLRFSIFQFNVEFRKVCLPEAVEYSSYNITDFPDTCASCCRRIAANKKYKCFPCSSCHCLVHRKCTKLSLALMNSMSKLDVGKWECTSCYNNKFPFGDIDNTGLMAETFNSNYNCPCQLKFPTIIIKRNIGSIFLRR